MDPEANSRPTSAAPAPALGGERRRPGRVESVSPELIPLLRAPAALGNGEPDALAEEADVLEEFAQDDDDLAPARGIAAGVGISVVIWCAIAACLRMVVG